ncbi:MerR family transcriptional regulator [Breznakiella homolactica]|uniref:MerR family transcriptional regulator n=1 Tax=Breznakiella homolactica TaxID=2798577 RepID=A0A7T8BAW9_9SPIR|nr:MerR family transcriptional regulator [Breznakiella homolactica]QQO09917.1 MerR family transcriptional regulator [Breznakiella homolactica]
MQYSIHEIAKIFGNTPGAIRFYEEVGLVNPGRDGAGSRVYTKENIMELFYLRKYCSFGLKLREVVEYFNDQNTKDLDAVSALLSEKQKEAEQQARYYEKSAQWIRQYNEKITSLESYVDIFHPVSVPDYYLLMDEDFVGKSPRQQSAVQKWIAVSPLSRISVVSDFAGRRLEKQRIAFSIQRENAEEFCLPLPPCTEMLDKGRCIYTVVKLESRDFDMIREEMYLDLISRMGNAGYAFSGRTVSNILFTHKIGGIQYKYFEVWLLCKNA